ncbi:MAG TPA: PAS domain-containing sensor histidine kinase [Candidatus Deferrimicrobium sp.]|nr:PAS domain-containing sensor histidine kinase [Candidatus Deferrimicrobium sp.]
MKSEESYRGLQGSESRLIEKLSGIEEKLSIISEQKLMGIVILQDNLIKYINTTAAQISEYPVEEIRGWSIDEFSKVLHPEDAPFVLEQARKKQVGESNVVPRYSYRLITKSGKVKWIDHYSQSVKFQGKLAILITFIDITGLKEIEYKLRESEEKFRTITEQSLMGIVILQDGLIKYINEMAANISGDSLEEIKGWSVNEFYSTIHPDDLPIVIEQARKKQRGDQDVIIHYTIRIKHKSGKIRWVDNYSKTINYQGRPADLATMIDITDRVEMEQKLRESKERYQFITENMEDIISILNKDLKIEYINESLAKISGFSITEVMNRSATNFIHPDDIQRALNLLEEGLKIGIGHEEFRLRRKDGTYIWTEIRAKVIYDKDNELKIIIVNRDIDDWKKLQVAKKEAEASLIESEKNYREAFTRAEFYKNLLSHDMSNILQSILLLIESSGLNLEQKDKLKLKLDDIKAQIKRGSKLISNVRKLSVLEKEKPALQSINICNLVQKAINYIQIGLINRKINIQFNRSGEKFIVQANDLLLDVFENILQNAVNYNENYIVEIEIRLSREQREEITFIKVEFIDNGIGIQDNSKKAIFERGYQEAIDVSGKGLGLSLVKNIIDSFNGQIWVEDKVQGDFSKGSNFMILLPEGSNNSQ